MNREKFRKPVHVQSDFVFAKRDVFLCQAAIVLLRFCIFLPRRLIIKIIEDLYKGKLLLCLLQNSM